MTPAEEKRKTQGKTERQIGRKASRTASRLQCGTSTADEVWERTVARATLPPDAPPLLVPVLAMFWALRETSVDMLACLLLRVILDARRQRLPAVAINYFGKGVGSRGWERKPGREDLTFGSCWMSCCYLPSQLHACLPCLALPCLAMPCFSFLFFLLLFLFFINSPGGRMEE